MCAEVNNDYNGNSIKVLKGLDAVRKRPGMYIGDTDDGSGLHHMVFEVVDNSIDEALAGYCDRVLVTIHADGSVSVNDDGRGIPVDINEDEGVSAAELVMTVLHAGGKFDQNNYKVSGGLHGVGVSVVNALSDKLVLTIKRNGKIWQQTYEDGGKPVAPIAPIAECPLEETGTDVRFWPSDTVFSNIVFDYKILEKRLRELSFLNSGVKIVLVDERCSPKKEDVFHYQGGIEAFINFLNEDKEKLTNKIFYCHQTRGDDGIEVEVAIQWVDTYTENVFCFTNNIPQKDGGTHLEGFRRGLSNSLKKYSESVVVGKKEKIDIQTEDFREGISAIVSVKVPDPKFSSQTKDKLVSSEVSSAVSSVVNEKLFEYLNENPNESKVIFEKILNAARYRIKARQIRDSNKKNFSGSMPDKLTDCVSKDPAVRELYIVEGDSAGGSAKSGRDPEFQAILPLRGKILNVEKTSTDKLNQITFDMDSTIGILTKVLGCGSVGNDDYNPDNIRYHNVVIMTDADVDGAHIRILLLTFFYRRMPEIIERGYVYIAQPPLYKFSKGNKVRFIVDEKEKNQYETSLALDKAKLFVNSAAAPIFGEPLEKIFLKYMNIFSVLDRVDREIPKFLTEQLLFVPRIKESDLHDQTLVAEWTSKYENRLKIKEHSGLRFKTELEHDSVNNIWLPKVFVRHNGVDRAYLLPYHFLVGLDYKAIADVSNLIVDLLEPDAYLLIGENRYDNLRDFGQVYDILIKIALKGISITRFKGLGEMNPDELFETTMNPENRVFLKVTIDDAIEADKEFSKLMGDVVEPRRDFIVANSHLAELDV